MQKYPHISESVNHIHISESYACILKMFAFMFLLREAEDKGQSIDFLISFEICSTPKLSK